MTATPSEAASIRRRLRFADELQYQLDHICAIRRARRGARVERIRNAGRRLFDHQERLRLGRPVSHPGRPHIAALQAGMRLPQDPRYRGYWYDADRHALVGLHLGLDLICHGGRFYVLECNLNPAIDLDLRACYGEQVAPCWGALAQFARAQGFERAVLCRREWTPWMLEELALASRQSGIQLQAATVPLRLGRRNAEIPMTNPLYALPRPLAPRTLYVLFSRFTETPLTWFVHDKVWTSRWVPEALEAHRSESGLLAHIPTYDRLIVPELLPDPRWPNLVVKLAELDRTLGVAMGRFANERQARVALQLDDKPGAVPAIFGRRGQGHTVIYQPFIPPEVVNDRALKLRMHTFISPLADAFLSVHAVHAAQELPSSLPMGLVPDPKVYAVSHAGGGRYEKVDPSVIQPLRTVAAQFGRLARFALGKRFQIGDAPAEARAAVC